MHKNLSTLKERFKKQTSIICPFKKSSSCFSSPVFNSHGKAGTRESPRPKAGTHGRDAPAPPLPPPPPPPPPLLRERSERAEAREHAREQQALANARGSANGLPPRRAAEELRKQVPYGQECEYDDTEGNEEGHCGSFLL